MDMILRFQNFYRTMEETNVRLSGETNCPPGWILSLVCRISRLFDRDCAG